MDEIIERMARDCAEAAFVAEGYELRFCGRHVSEYRHPETAIDRANNYREGMRAAVAALLRRFMLESPIPGEVSGERLEQIKTFRADPSEWARDQADAAVDDLLAQLAHLTRLVQLMAADEDWQRVSEAFKLGEESGARRQREADMRFVKDEGLFFAETSLKPR